MPARLPKYKNKQKKPVTRQNNSIVAPDFSNPPTEYRRTRMEREEEGFKIMNTMIETGFTVSKYPCLQVLIDSVFRYIHEGVRIPLEIPLPEIDRTITGTLAIDRREQVVVCLKVGCSGVHSDKAESSTVDVGMTISAHEASTPSSATDSSGSVLDTDTEMVFDTFE
jgi:hypothetical protein